MEKNIFLIGIFIIFCTFSISSCSTGLTTRVSAKSLDLKTQSIDSEHGYSAIAVWSLHIEDLTGTFNGWSPIFSIGPLGAANTLCNYLTTGQTKEMSPAEFSKYAKIEPVNGSWTNNDERTFYDGLFVVELQPGEREFFHLRIENQDAISDRILSEHWLSIPLNAPCKIEENRVYDLKHLEIVITEKIKGKNGKFQFNYEVSSTDENSKNYMKLNEQYPQLKILEYKSERGCSFRGPKTICQ
jgi:hypothetical protein